MVLIVAGFMGIANRGGEERASLRGDPSTPAASAQDDTKKEPNPLTPFPYKEGGTEKKGRTLPFNTVGGVEPFKGSTDFFL
jgi:hypothetical protein